MKRFFIHIVIFLFIPLIIGILPGYLAMWQELSTLKNSEKFLYNPKTFDQLANWKLQRVEEQKFDVIAFGTSRVNQFTQEMFEEEISFFNFTIPVTRIEDLDLLADFIIAKNKPKTIIFGIDQWMLNEEYHSKTQKFFKKSHFNFFSLSQLVNKYVSQNGEYPNEFNNYKLIGLKARQYLSGYRKDGSYTYGKTYYEMCCGNQAILNDYQFRDTLERIKEGKNRFQFNDEYSTKSLNKIDAILKKLKDNEIKVVGFFPPLAPTINEKMQSSGNYRYIEKSKQPLSDTFKKYDFDFYDFTEINVFDDTYYVDGFHANRNIYYEMLKDMNSKSNLKIVDENFDNKFMIGDEEKKLLIDFFESKNK